MALLATIWISAGFRVHSTLHAAERVTVALTITGVGGSELTEAYVAVVPPDHQWSKPSFEQILRRGRGAITAPSTAYKVFVAAKGYQPRILQPAPHATTLKIELNAEVVTRGTVSDEQGNPLDGAHVSRAGIGVRAPAGDFSATARQFLVESWSMRVDSSGSWTLPASDNMVAPILIEAPGYSPAWVLGQAGKHFDVVLRRGGGLELKLDRIELGTFLTLTNAAVADGGIPGAWQSRVWARAADRATLIWESLPAGHYDVFAGVDDPLRFAGGVRKVGSIALRRGERGRLDVTLPRFPARASEHVSIFLPGKSTQDLDRVTAVAASETSVRAAPVTVVGTAGGVVALVGASPASTTIYGVTPNALIVTDKPLTGGTSYTGKLVQRGELTLQLVSANRETSLPSHVTARPANCANGAAIRLPVQVEAEGMITIPYPVDCRALVLDSRPFEPLVREIQLGRGERRDLGVITLGIAASADVQVAIGTAATPAGRIPVRVYDVRPDGEAAEVLVAEAITGADGWASLSSLPVGREIRIEARAAEGDLSVSETVQIRSGERAVIGPLLLPAPASLTVAARLGSAVARRFADLRISSVLIERTDERGRKVRLSAPVDAKDRKPATFANLHPARWTISVLAGTPDWVHAFAAGAIDLEPGDDRRTSPEVNPPVFDVFVTYGGTAVAATVAITDSKASATTRSFNSGSDGRATIVLPEPGAFTVHVRPLSGADVIPVGEVDFAPERPVTIEIPAAELDVLVKNDGGIVRGATIEARRRNPALRRGTADLVATKVSGDDGRARFVVPAGLWRLTAKLNAQTAEKQVSVGELDSVAVELRLSAEASIEGNIRGAEGLPVAAHVECLIKTALEASRVSGGTTSDGHFRVSLPAPLSTQARCAAILPAGRVEPFTGGSSGPVNVRTSGVSGTLVIDDWLESSVRDHDWLVSDTGGVINLTTVATRSRQLTGPLAIAVPAGSWRLVQIRQVNDWVALATGNFAALTEAAHASVDSQEIKHLRLKPSDREGGVR